MLGGWEGRATSPTLDVVVLYSQYGSKMSQESTIYTAPQITGGGGGGAVP